MSRIGKENIPNFLCDTWWYGLTSRLNERKFEELAKLRSSQGFNAVQLVVGIPPEVGPENKNATSQVGPAWNLQGDFNEKYLDFARNKIQQLNNHGLTVIVYGAWGQQIEWLGVDRMKDWWEGIIHKLDDLNVMYCLTGESDIWIGEEKKLLPDKTTGDLSAVRAFPFLHPRLIYLGKRLITMINEPLIHSGKENRKEKWSNILAFVSSLTNRPIFIHTLPNRNSEEVVNNPELLNAVTVQTGHDIGTKKNIWQIPLEISNNYPNKPFINLEPWYEGINGRFGTNDQLYAYWASMMAGSHAFCYGAQGVWNVGEGEFLSHWGNQSLDEAMKLDTPRLIGESHKLFTSHGYVNYSQVEVEDRNGEILKITRYNEKGDFICYTPDILLNTDLPNGTIFLPLEAKFSRSLPKRGQVVILSEI